MRTMFMWLMGKVKADLTKNNNLNYSTIWL